MENGRKLMLIESWLRKWKIVQYQQNTSENLFSLSISKVVYLRPFYSSLSFPKIWKQNFMYFERKYIETEPSYSHEFATFLKYHILLIYGWSKICLVQKYYFFVLILSIYKYILFKQSKHFVQIEQSSSLKLKDINFY